MTRHWATEWPVTYDKWQVTYGHHDCLPHKVCTYVRNEPRTGNEGIKHAPTSCHLIHSPGVSQTPDTRPAACPYYASIISSASKHQTSLSLLQLLNNFDDQRVGLLNDALTTIHQIIYIGKSAGDTTSGCIRVMYDDDERIQKDKDRLSIMITAPVSSHHFRDLSSPAMVVIIWKVFRI